MLRWTLPHIMDYHFGTTAEYSTVMNLLATEQLKGRLLIRTSALICFVVAGALLAASLFVPHPAQVGSENGAASGFTASIR